ncbi:hypothetical protein BC629DRAFT_1201402 [Irpex lacteus]|nr:hypothetical protein BC629DRAFT_1201402 [Irpex lacteus]
MYNRPSKRKANRHHSPHRDYTQPDPALYIQAHEAEIIRGPQARSLARSLEAKHADSVEVKTRLVKLGAPSIEQDGLGSQAQAVWVDRYDVRLLLDTLPPSTSGPGDVDTARLSPTGWSDLPSDSEDTFFFSPDEVEDYHREKRRRMIDQSREERLRALRAESGDDAAREEEEDPWGGSDEEELMRRTATHILNSPNPAQLEMRILANHGADKRFAFLRGRWSRAWKITKGRIRLELEAARNKSAEEEGKKAGLGGLSGYGDSDASDEEEGDDEGDGGKGELEPKAREEGTTPAMTLSEEAIKEARRAKAKQWAEQRRAAKANEI